jgi:hypothetical protein
MKKIWLILIVVFGLSGTANFGWTASFLYDPGPHNNGFWLNNGVFTPEYSWPGVFTPMGPEGKSSGWTVVNWGDLANWPNDPQTDRKGGLFFYHPIAGYLHWYVSPRGGHGLEVGRDTTWSGWDNNNYGAEHDDGLVANYPGWGSQIPDGIIPDEKEESPALSQLKALRIKAFQRVLSAWQGTRTGQDYVNTSLIIIFWNEIYRQQLWWYVSTYDSRALYPDAFWNEAGCQYQAPEGFKGSAPFYEYIVIDGVQNYGKKPLVQGKAGRIYTLNILPRLTEAVNNALPAANSREDCLSRGGTGISVSLDTDLSHWKVSTIFIGSIVGGEGTIVSQHDSINLTYIKKHK